MRKKLTGLRFQNNSKSANSHIPIGKKQRLTIKNLSHDGRGITLLDNKTWFVAGALPKEEVIARVLSSQSKWVNAKCEEIITTSTNRQVPPCHYATTCGGCGIQHIPYPEQITLKQQNVIEQFQRLANITISSWQAPHVSNPLGYRRIARIAVRYNEQTAQLDIGFRAAFSQQIINIKHCLVLDKAIQPLLADLPTYLAKLTAKKYIGHIELFSGSVTAMLIRHTVPLPANDKLLLNDFCKANHCQLWLQGKDNPAPYLTESPLTYPLTINQRPLILNYRMGDFIQVNPTINQAMVRQALNWLQLKPNEVILDLFSGLGNFTLPLATQAKQVIAIEVVASMVEATKYNALQNNLNNVECYQADLNQILSEQYWAKYNFSAILLDPPREGAVNIVKNMKKFNSKRILYVSCNPATLARDAKLLIEQGYQISKAGIMDMFPQTAHVEVMVLFER